MRSPSTAGSGPLRVVFDLDDTLYPERQFAISGFRACADWIDSRHPPGPSTTVAGEALVTRMTGLLDEGHMRRLFEIALEERVGAYHPETLDAFIDVYRLHPPRIALYDDADAVLTHYQRHGPIGLITDGQAEVQASKVGALALEPRFRHIVYTGALGGRQFHKPHPLAFELMEAELDPPFRPTAGDAGASGSRAKARFVYVGDNPAKDFVSPNARGWITVQVLRPNRIHARATMAAGGAARHVIETLADLPAVLGA